GQLGAAADWEPAEVAGMHPGRTARACWRGEVVGVVGEAHPDLLTGLDLDEPVFLAEIRLAPFERGALRPVRYRRPSRHPAIRRDLAFIVPERVPASRVDALLRSEAGPLLEELVLFDVYSGPPVPAGRRSLAYSATFRAPDRTLTVVEVD